MLEGADEDGREAILDLLPDRDAPTTLFEAERIAEEAAARALAYLRSEGYYSAEVTPEASENPPSARLVIAPGPRFRFAAPLLQFDGAAPNDTIAYAVRAELSRVHQDAPARSVDVLEAEAAALAALQNAGYADAKAGERRVVVDHATAFVTPTFHLNAGPPTKLGEIRAQPEDVFRPRFLRRLRAWDYGDSYKPELLTNLRRDLAATGAVSRVATRLSEPNAEGVRDVIVEIEPAKRNAYELGLGWSTTEGLGVEAEWTRRNISGRADSLTFGTQLGELAQGFSVELLRPHAAGIGHAQRFNFNVSREDTDAYVREGVSLSASVDAAPRLRLGTSYGVAISADQFEQTAGGVSEAFVLSGFGEIRRDTTGHPLDARDGSIVQLRAEPSVSTGDATLGFVRFIGEGRIYESFGEADRFTLAARARTGWVSTVSGDPDDLPPDRRFYAGGGGSVRGYEYNSIYPEERDLLGLTPGGQGSLEVSVEGRWRFTDTMGAAAFIDGGNAFDDFGDAADLRWGAGVGFRYDLGFAPLRVDFAVPLDPRDSDPDYALYISLGQAF